jgi:16S rRNA (cytosine1402-N4)-methyltransferase
VEPPKKKKRPYHRKRREKRVRSTTPGEHVSVLPVEVLEILNPQPGQIIVDGTLGFAGHSAAILSRLGDSGQLIAFDLDGTNLPAASARLGAISSNFQLHHANFAALGAVLAEAGIAGIDGLLADLGMSSMQLDDRERGFSMLRDGPLDMRMDQSRGKTAAELVNTMSVEDLTQAFLELGDEPRAERIAMAIVEARTATPFERTAQLRDFIENAAPVEVLRGPGSLPARKQRLLPATRVFQSLRILVNRELASLQSLLRTVPYLLNPGGTVAIISFHSGEDRLVKASFKEGFVSGLYASISDEPIRPTEAERTANPRARSAKLRWAKRAG